VAAEGGKPETPESEFPDVPNRFLKEFPRKFSPKFLRGVSLPSVDILIKILCKVENIVRDEKNLDPHRPFFQFIRGRGRTYRNFNKYISLLICVYAKFIKYAKISDLMLLSSDTRFSYVRSNPCMNGQQLFQAIKKTLYMLKSVNEEAEKTIIRMTHYYLSYICHVWRSNKRI